ncbi:MAG TPA: hypothetical protein VFJ12_05880 [Segeticoccus sp.]|nr:hypothetical protein [Segeticoccus sp.]
MTRTQRKPGAIQKVTRRWLQQNEASADAWTRWAHPRPEAKR